MRQRRSGRWDQAAHRQQFERSATRPAIRCVTGGAELIAALKAAYQATESKLDDATTPAAYEAVNDRVVCTTDPDATVVRNGSQPPRPRYHHHRAVDDAQGVITAVETTTGSIAENKRLLPLVQQHQTPIPDRACAPPWPTASTAQPRTSWPVSSWAFARILGDARAKQNHARSAGIFPDSAFHYEARHQHGALSRRSDDETATAPPAQADVGILATQSRLRRLYAPIPMHPRHRLRSHDSSA